MPLCLHSNVQVLIIPHKMSYYQYHSLQCKVPSALHVNLNVFEPVNANMIYSA